MLLRQIGMHVLRRHAAFPAPCRRPIRSDSHSYHINMIRTLRGDRTAVVRNNVAYATRRRRGISQAIFHSYRVAFAPYDARPRCQSAGRDGSLATVLRMHTHTDPALAKVLESAHLKKCWNRMRNRTHISPGSDGRQIF